MSFDETLRLIVREELRSALKDVRVAAPVLTSPSTTLELLTVEDVSVACHVAAATVRAWLRRGKLIGKKVGRGYLVERSALNRFLSAIIPALKDGDGAESEIERILQRARGR